MYKLVERPGYFGRQRDKKIAAYNKKYGVGNWELKWVIATDKDTLLYNFEEACKHFYEYSYYLYLKDRQADLDFICSYKECIDNALTNIESGLNYSKQEAFSTHIQDIAVRNVLNRLNLKFSNDSDKILVIRSKDSEGFKFGPGNVPFYDANLITQPSLCPFWANKNSVEDFWQSNKWIVVKN